MRSATYDADIEKMYGTADADLTFTETAGKIKLTNSGYGYPYYPTGLDALAREVKALFSNSEQGVWYDPSDLTTLYQDAAGTTPVTAVEQPVGLMLDKSGRGNHAYQTTSASRPVLSALVNQYLNTATLATQNVTTLATTYTLRFEGAGSITLSGTATGTYTAGAHSVVCTAGTLTSTVTGTVTNADLRPTNAGVNLPPYQRVTTSTDYDTAGFPAYLKFDGIDDSLVTNSIDFTSTDKMTVCAGVRKLSASTGIITELSSDILAKDGVFYLAINDTGGTERAGLHGVGAGLTTAGFVATVPSSYVHVANFDVSKSDSSDQLKGRGNGVPYINNDTTPTTATASFGNYPLYIGSRAGTVLRYNGHLYSLIVRGAQSSDAQIASVEGYVNGKTKAYA